MALDHEQREAQLGVEPGHVNVNFVARIEHISTAGGAFAPTLALAAEGGRFFPVAKRAAALRADAIDTVGASRRGRADASTCDGAPGGRLEDDPGRGAREARGLDSRRAPRPA